MKNRFSDFFPLPKFLEMRSMGLSISERSIHVVEFVRKSHGLVLGRYGTKKIPPGSIKEGYVNDKNAIIDVLKSLQKELSIEFVNVSLPEEKTYLFNTEFPKENSGDFRQAIEFRLEENAPVSPSEAVFDYSIIDNSQDSENIKVSVAVVPAKVVDTYLEIVKSAGLKPVSFGIKAAAVGRAVVPSGNDGTFMVVDIGSTGTSLSVISKGVAQFSLTVPIGGEDLNNDLAKAFSIDLEAAKKMKEEKAFTKNKDNGEIFQALVNTFSSIKDEVNKLIIYWNTHHVSDGTNKNNIEKIILSGKNTAIDGFDDYLSSSVKMEVEIANVWQNAFTYDSHVPAINYLDSLDFASAIGLALPEK